MSAEEQKEYNVYPKLNVYQVFNVAQTNLKEARPELYAKLEAENKPEKALVQEGDMYSFPAVDKMFTPEVDLSYQHRTPGQCILFHFSQ